MGQQGRRGMGHVRQGEIYVVPVHFSDFSVQKRRPIIILSNDDFNRNSEDVIICMITSQLKGRGILITDHHLKEGHLLKHSLVKTEHVHKMRKNLLGRKIGSLQPEAIRAIKKHFFSLF